MRGVLLSLLNRLLLGSILACAILSFASAKEIPEASAVALRVDQDIHLDGVLDDAAWKSAPLLRDFLQREPREGDPATEATEVRVVYGKRAIYFGVTCFDSEPAKIKATERRRDGELENDDSFTILLDTFHDHRNAYFFRTNALGTQYDAQITDEKRQMNIQWDEKWAVEARVTSFGWVAEIEIPLKSLRSPYRPQQVWGLNFERRISRKNESTYWSGHSRDYEFWNVSQAGHLAGLEDVKTGLSLRVKPFTLGGFRQSRSVEDGEASEGVLDVGLEDVKVSITPSVTADFTLYPDFAQTEVDASRVNLTRFSLFFPEKREFFLEGAGIFEFGSEMPRFGFMPPEMVVFYSRRIGLGEEGEQIPIFMGGKVTGDVNGFQFGALNMQTKRLDEFPGTNFSVARVKKKLLDRSYVGGIVTNLFEADTGHFNRVAGADANFVLFDKMSIKGFLSKSITEEERDDDLAYQGYVGWESDEFQVSMERSRIERNYDPEIGFVLRNGTTKSRARVAWTPRPGISWIRQLWLSTENTFYTSHDGYLETRENEVFGGLRLESGDFFGVGLMKSYESLDEPFEVHPDYDIPTGSYDNLLMNVFGRSYSGRRFSSDLMGSFGGFYNGTIASVSWGPLVKVNDSISVKIDHGINHVTLPEGEFTAQVLNSQVNWNLSNRILTSAAVQYNSVAESYLVNLRFNYIYRPGDDIFVVYNENQRFDVSPDGEVDRTLLIKFTHSFDF